MLNLATNYENGNANLDCSLCEEAEDTLSQMTHYMKYSHLASSFFTDDLFSSETVNTHKATIAINKGLRDKGVLISQNGYHANIHNQILLRYKNSQHPSPNASTFIAF